MPRTSSIGAVARATSSPNSRATSCSTTGRRGRPRTLRRPATRRRRPRPRARAPPSGATDPSATRTERVIGSSLEAQARDRDHHRVAGPDLRERTRAVDRAPPSAQDQLVGPERGPLRAEQELVPRHRSAPPSGRHQLDVGVVHREHGKRVAGRRPRPEVPAHGPPGADLRGAHRPGGLHEGSARPEVRARSART